MTDFVRKTHSVAMELYSHYDLQQHQRLSILVVSLVIFGVWVVSVIVHRLFVHPLAKYPGPFFSRISGLSTLYHAWKGDLHYHLYDLHRIYGERVRYSPNKLSLCNLRAVNDIYGFNKNVDKPEEFYSAFRINKHAINTFNTSSKESHRRKRRIMAKAFSESALISYEGFIAERVDEFMKKLRTNFKAYKGRFDFSYEFNCLMLDIMGGLCFGEAFGFIAGRGDEILRQAHRRTFRIYMTGHEPLLKKSYIDRLIFPGLFRASTVLADYAKLNTFKRIAKYNNGEGNVSNEKNYSDIMTHLLDAGDEETGTKYSNNELLGEGVLMMMAGSDTSSSSLTATLFYLAHNSWALAKLRRELHERFPTKADIKPREAEACTYLRACMNEAMRLSPPAPTNIPRVVGPNGIQVDGEFFQEGVYIGAPNFALFRDTRYFGGVVSPHEYVPERWIVGNHRVSRGINSAGTNEETDIEISKEDVKNAQAAFLPFSTGPRHCIGKHLAMKEVSYILATLLHEFSVEPLGDSGVLKRNFHGSGQHPRWLTMEQSDVYTSVEHDILLRLTKVETDE